MGGFRGYVHGRPFLGERTPQSVQNIVIRDYCRRHGIEYLLSAVEYSKPDSYLILNALLMGLPLLDGIVAYSMFQLPSKSSERMKVYDRILRERKSLRFALENLSIQSPAEIDRIEMIWKVRLVLPYCPTAF